MPHDVARIVDSFNDQLITMDARARAMHGRAYGGALRSLKGRLVEDLARDIVLLAWSRAGHSSRQFEITRTRVPVKAPGIRSFSISPEAGSKADLVYPVGVDLHILVEDELVAAVECKSYTENAMLKRVLVDFHLMRMPHPGALCVLFQLESQLGRAASGPNVVPSEIGNSSTRALLSLFPDVDLRIITMLEGERDINRPIHKYPKALSRESVDFAAQVLEQSFQS